MDTQNHPCLKPIQLTRKQFMTENKEPTDKDWIYGFYLALCRVPSNGLEMVLKTDKGRAAYKGFQEDMKTAIRKAMKAAE